MTGDVQMFWAVKWVNGKFLDCMTFSSKDDADKVAKGLNGSAIVKRVFLCEVPHDDR